MDINSNINHIDDFSHEEFSDNSIVWKEKYEQVEKLLYSYNLFSEHLIKYSMDFYFNKLGFNKFYLEKISPEVISKIVTCIITAKINEKYSSDKYFPIYEQKHDNIIYIVTRVYAEDKQTRLNYKMEKKIEKKYFNFRDMSKACYRLKSFRSTYSLFDKECSYQEPLRTYILELPTYPDGEISKYETDLSKLVDVSFYNKIKGTVNEKFYYELNKAVMCDLTGQFIQVHYCITSSSTFTLNIAVNRNNVISTFFSLVGDCLNMHRCFSYSKYVEPLKNGVLLMILNIKVINDPEQEKKTLDIKNIIHMIIKSLKSLHLIINPQYIQLSVKRIFTSEECAYINIIIDFISFFPINSYSSYKNVENELHLKSENNISIMNDFYLIKENLKSSKYAKNEILMCAQCNVETVKALFANFERKYNKTNIMGDISECKNYKSSKDIINEIEDNYHKKILKYFYIFEKYLVKTNFFLTHKIGFAVSFDGSLLKDSIYETEPYSIIMVSGLHYVGFHIRFNRISRGGIRIVISNNHNSYMHNLNNIFDEAYNLALTQNFKNKDIPEGGSKGIILLSSDDCNNEDTKYIKKLCYYSYVNSLLDLMLNTKDEIFFANSFDGCIHLNGFIKNNDIVDKGSDENLSERKSSEKIMQDEDCIFLGPDENTASDKLMDWAIIIAKKRNYKYWKTFSTGKLRKNGGIPHDFYGMTTLGIETYIRKLCEKLNIVEENIYRSIVGGPDGDLGSNSILQSKTHIISIIDGSGILYDKNGLNKKELIRLAKRRNYKKKKLNTNCVLYNEKYLSKDGFKISIEDHNVKIFGEIIKNGLDFRNNFHLNSLNKCDLFNPCGGRPQSINIFNVNNIIKDGKCIYKYIVEGANLFISDDARRILESKNVILFKDASTNKGGVISSSLEVLVGFVLDDDAYIKYMCTPDSDLFLEDNQIFNLVNQYIEKDVPLSNKPLTNTSNPGNCKNKDSDVNEDDDDASSGSESEYVSSFYKEYIKEIQEKIKSVCELEFECLWNETRRTKTYICEATTILSKKINDLKKDILDSDILCNNYKLIKNVLINVIPKTLLKVVSFEKIVERVPNAYLRYLFASTLASNYYYSQKFLSNISTFNFFEYIRKMEMVDN